MILASSFYEGGLMSERGQHLFKVTCVYIMRKSFISKTATLLYPENSSCASHPYIPSPCPLGRCPWTRQDPSRAHFLLDSTPTSQLPSAKFHVPYLCLHITQHSTKHNGFHTLLLWPVDAPWRVGITLRSTPASSFHWLSHWWPFKTKETSFMKQLWRSTWIPRADVKFYFKFSGEGHCQVDDDLRFWKLKVLLWNHYLWQSLASSQIFPWPLSWHRETCSSLPCQSEAWPSDMLWPMR